MKTKAVLLFYLFVYLAACAGPRAYFVDPEVRPYLNKYNDYKVQYLGVEQYYQINIYFANLEGNTAGLCRQYSDGAKEIYIDRLIWDNMSFLDKEVVVLHEMGHCDLNLDHFPSPSIMQKRHLGGYLYSLDKEYYLEELFLSKTGYNLESKLDTEIDCEH